jgi:hypothetical protein
VPVSFPLSNPDNIASTTETTATTTQTTQTPTTETSSSSIQPCKDKKCNILGY